MSDNEKLLGKNALVTGGSRGIGRQVALALAQQGVNIALNYNRSESEANRILSEMKAYNIRCIAVHADVSKRSEVDRMMDTIKNGNYSAGLTRTTGQMLGLPEM